MKIFSSVGSASSNPGARRHGLEDFLRIASLRQLNLGVVAEIMKRLNQWSGFEEVSIAFVLDLYVIASESRLHFAEFTLEH